MNERRTHAHGSGWEGGRARITRQDLNSISVADTVYLISHATQGLTTTIRMLWVRVVASSRPHLTILSITEMRTADDSCRGEKGLLASLPSFSLSTTIIAVAFLPSSSVRPWMARPFARRFRHFAIRLYYAYSGSGRYLNGFRLRGFTFCRHPLHLARVCSTSEPYFTSHCDESDLKMNEAARQSLKGRMIKIPDIGIIWCRRIKGAQGPCRSQHTDRLACLGPFFYSWQQAVQIWRLCFSLFPSHPCSCFRFYYTAVSSEAWAKLRADLMILA